MRVAPEIQSWGDGPTLRKSPYRDSCTFEVTVVAVLGQGVTVVAVLGQEVTVVAVLGQAVTVVALVVKVVDERCENVIDEILQLRLFHIMGRDLCIIRTDACPCSL